MIEYQGLETVIPPELVSGLDPRIVDRLLADIAEAARDMWIQLAGDALNARRRDYINGIQPVYMQQGLASITLVGNYANFIENGGPSQDMRDFLLGPDVPVVPRGERGKHLNKDGQAYRSIPFSHGAPGGSGKTSQPMGSAYSGSMAESDAKKLGKDIYNQARGLLATTSDPYGGTNTGGRLKSPIGGQLAPLLRPHHKTNIYEGMIRQEKTYKTSTQSTYTTFRTISEANKEGWIRPATPGVELAPQVAKFAAELAPMAFAAYVEGLTDG